MTPQIVDDLSNYIAFTANLTLVGRVVQQGVLTYIM